MTAQLDRAVEIDRDRDADLANQDRPPMPPVYELMCETPARILKADLGDMLLPGTDTGDEILLNEIRFALFSQMRGHMNLFDDSCKRIGAMVASTAESYLTDMWERDQ